MNIFELLWRDVRVCLDSHGWSISDGPARLIDRRGGGWIHRRVRADFWSRLSINVIWRLRCFLLLFVIIVIIIVEHLPASKTNVCASDSFFLIPEVFSNWLGHFFGYFFHYWDRCPPSLRTN